MTSLPTISSSRFRADQVLTFALVSAAVLAGSVLLFVFGFLIRESWPALQGLGAARFFTDEGWFPTAGEFNLLPMVAGTALVTTGALALAVPLGLASAVFGRFYAPTGVAWVHRRLVELLAGIPSVVYGLWGLVVLVPLLAHLGGSGQNLLAAILLLGLMVLPTVTLTADAALAAVPRTYLQGAAALGLGRWSTVRRVALPAARRGIVTGIILAAGRAVGETMAVLMVAGNVIAVPGSLLDPVRTLTANIALEMGYATQDHRSVLFVSGLILLMAVAALVLWAHGQSLGVGDGR